MKCVSCLSAQQVLDAGEFDEDPVVEAMVRENARNGKVVVIARGNSLCEWHFNVQRQWPGDYPASKLPAHVRDKIGDAYREIASDVFDSSD